jgi:hypothetical protein
VADKRAGQPNGTEQAERLQHDIEAIRGNLGGLVSELRERGREAVDVRLQVRRHGVAVGLGALAVAALVAGGIALHRARERRRQTLPARLRRLREAVARMMDDPDRVAEARPRVSRKIAASGGSAAASVLAKRIAQRLIRGH